jgi:hypothetical protein
MRSDAALASYFAKSYKAVLSLCAASNQSLLFREFMRPSEYQNYTLESLAQASNETRTKLLQVFGPNCTYDAVVDAIKTLRLSNDEDAAEKEIRVLLFIKELHISELDIDDFRTVSLLFDLAQTIQRFLAFCKNFGFAVAKACPTFQSLRTAVETFYAETGNHDVDHCQDFLKQITDYLCHQYIGNCAIASVQRVALQNHSVPMLSLLASLAKYPDFLAYVDEMNWMGADGLKRFYEEYGNVTNALLGDSQSYEMSLLDSMAPAVRLVSSLESAREVVTHTDLFKALSSNQEVADSLGSRIEDDIAQVYGKLSEIKDWFANGLDNVTTAHTFFNAAINAGHYFLDSGEVQKNGS